jgi:hypothetical protein
MITTQAATIRQGYFALSRARPRVDKRFLIAFSLSLVVNTVG